MIAAALGLLLLTGATLAEDIPVPSFDGAGILVIGEVHDNPEHHAIQARIVEAWQPHAIVFEMLTPEAALRVTEDNRTDAAALEAELNWHESGWPEFAMYHPIFTAAPDAAIFGAARPREEVREAVSTGAAEVFGEGAPLFGLDQPLPADQLDTRTALQQEAHCNALPEDILPGMVEAQRLRDAALAQAAVAAYLHASASSEDPRVIVIAGNGHTREDWGVPALLRHYYQSDQDAPEIQSLGQFEADAPPDAPFTQTTTSPAPDRDDPCLAFAK